MTTHYFRSRIDRIRTRQTSFIEFKYFTLECECCRRTFRSPAPNRKACDLCRRCEDRRCDRCEIRLEGQPG